MNHSLKRITLLAVGIGGLFFARPLWAQETPAPADAAPTQELSPGESEPASPTAILRSGARRSFFSKGQLEAAPTDKEKASIADNCQFGKPEVTV